MADVARRAGVSIATVSRALRDVPGVSDATRVRIRAIADELSYVVSPEASGLARRETGRVAVVVPRIDIWFYSTMLASIERTLRAADLDMLVYQVDGEEQRSRFFERAARPTQGRRRRADRAAAAASARWNGSTCSASTSSSQAGGCATTRTSEVDDHAIAMAAMGHLLDLGHRRIAMIRTSDTAVAAHSSELRAQPRLLRLARGGRASRSATSTSSPFPTARRPAPAASSGCWSSTSRRRRCSPSPTRSPSARSGRSRCAASTYPARCPSSAWTAIPLAELFGLTTVEQSVEEQGRLSGEMAIRLLRGEELDRFSVVVPSKLVLRKTTAAPR